MIFYNTCFIHNFDFSRGGLVLPLVFCLYMKNNQPFSRILIFLVITLQQIKLG